MYRSVKPITITLVMTWSFIFICGLIGVTLLRGKYYHCDNYDLTSLSSIKTKYDCLNAGGDWINPERNFDNILVAMLTLFEMMASEDWLTTAL